MLHARQIALYFSLMLLVLGFWDSQSASGQVTTATLSGDITDPTGAPVPDASVTATNVSTGISSKTTSEASGSYILPSLLPGNYSVTVEKTGFRSKTLTGIELLVAQKATLNVQVEVGEVATSVEVRGDVTPVDTGTATISQVIGATETTELPLNLRRFGSLALLIPGTVTALDRGGFAGGFNPFAAGSAYYANGGRSSGNNPIVDGVMNRALSGGGFAVQPTPDAVQEFRIQTNTYNASYGMASGSVINLVTKSGTNSLHGSVYEFLRNDKLDARNFFSASRGRFIRNQFGFALGGPIKKNKTFIFGNFEPLRQIKGLTQSAIVPTAAQKRGDLSSALTGGSINHCGTGGPPNLQFDSGQLFDPATIASFTCPPGSAKAGQSILIGTPLPGNIIPNIDPVAQKVLSTLYNVDPNRVGFPNYVSNRPSFENDWIWQTRVDHTFSSKDSVFARYLFGESHTGSFSALPTSGGLQYFRGQSAIASWTHVFSPSLLHEARVGFQRNFQISSCLGCPRAPGTIASFGVQGHAGIGPTQEKYPQFNFLPSASRGAPGSFTVFTSAGDGPYTPQFNPDMMETYQYHLTRTRGRHTIQLGTDMSFWQSLRTQTAFAPNGLFFFDGRFSSLAGQSTAAGVSPIADFILGYPQSAQRTFRFKFLYQRGGGFWNYYIHDDFKVSRNLTLNLGLRYEYRRPATDENGSYMSILKNGRPFAGPGNALMLTALPPDQNDALCTDPQFSFLTSADGRCLVAIDALRRRLGFVGRRRETISDPEHDRFAPRLGIAWRPTGSNRLVVRTGAGLFYDMLNLNNQHFGDNNPVFAPSQIYDAGGIGAPPPKLPNGQPTRTATAFAGTVGIPRPDQQFVAAFLDPDYKTPVVEQWSFGIQSELQRDTALEVDYVGNHGYHLGTLLYFANQPEPGIGPLQPRRPYPDFAPFLYTDSSANSWYHALQVKLNKRMTHSFSVLASYTWAKTLDDNEGDECFTCGTGQLGPQDYNNIAANKGRSAADVRSRAVFSGIWRLPFGAGERFGAGVSRGLNHFVGGWSFSYIFTAQSGFPLTIVSVRDFSNTGSVAPRPDRLCEGTGSRDITNYFNSSCFSIGSLQSDFEAGKPRFGNSGRGILDGPRYINLDLSVLKDTSITERVKLQFRAEAYNSLNKAHFGDPNTAVGNPAFGKVLGTRADPRDIQFGLKVIF